MEEDRGFEAGYVKFLAPKGEGGISGMKDWISRRSSEMEGLYLWPRKVVVLRRFRPVELELGIGQEGSDKGELWGWMEVSELEWLVCVEKEWRVQERRSMTQGVSENINVDGKFTVASSRVVIMSSAKSESVAVSDCVVDEERWLVKGWDSFESRAVLRGEEELADQREVGIVFGERGGVVLARSIRPPGNDDELAVLNCLPVGVKSLSLL